jgi:hypothetical protein
MTTGGSLLTLPATGSVTGRMVEAEERLRRAIKLDKDLRGSTVN